MTLGVMGVKLDWNFLRNGSTKPAASSLRETRHSLPSSNRNPAIFVNSSAVTQQKTGNTRSFTARKGASLLCEPDGILTWKLFSQHVNPDWNETTPP
jgi:hypothetical protein